MPDPKYWEGLGEHEMDEEPIPWKEWEKKYPGLIKFPKKEVELPLFGNGFGFRACQEIQKGNIEWIPIPLHLRKEDAGPVEIPGVDFDDYPLDFDKGMKPEIYVKYRTPPMNNPNWVDFKTWDKKTEDA